MKSAAEPSENWTDLTHWDLTDIAALRMGFSPAQRSILRHNVLIPDMWGVLDKIRHYMPLCSIFAAELTREAVRMAKKPDSTTNALKILGHAMHFLQDAGNPWHARPLLPFCQRNHTLFEEYVAANMREGFCFRNALMNAPALSIPHPEFIHRIGDGAVHLAKTASRKFPLLDSAIRNDLFWKQDENIAAVTLELLTGCLHMTEAQIYSFSIRALSEPQPFSLPAAVTWTFLGSDRRRLIE